MGRKGSGEHPDSLVQPTVRKKKAPETPTALGGGGVMKDGVDEEEARAGRLDRWIPWETEEWVVPMAPDREPFPLSRSLVFVQGDPYPELCAQRADGGLGFTLLRSATEGR
jgi:hypothetical protein